MNRLGWEQRFGRAAAPMQRGGGRGGDELGWKSGLVIVRLHAIGTWSATAVADISPYNVSLVPEDPSVVYTNAVTLVDSDTGTPANVRILPGSVAGTLLTKKFGSGVSPVSNVGSQLRLELLWVQGATPAVGAQTFSMSCDLVGRYR